MPTRSSKICTVELFWFLLFIFMIWIIGYRTVFSSDISPQESIMDDKIVSAGFPVKERYNCNINMDYLLDEFQNLYSKSGLPFKTQAIISRNKRCWKNIAFKLNGLSNPDIVSNETYSNCNKIYHEQMCGMAKAQLILPLSNTCQDQYEIIRFWGHNCYGGISASFAGISDIAFAEESSMIGFAGQHIVKNQTREVLPEDFQTAESLLKTGFVDAVYHRKEINEKIMNILKILLHKHDASSEVNDELTNETSENNQSSRAIAS